MINKQSITYFFKTVLFFALIFLGTKSFAQPKSGQVIDEIVAVVADKIVLHSEVEFEFQQLKREYGPVGDTIKCDILTKKLTDNLMLVKAQVDSIDINEERVDAEQIIKDVKVTPTDIKNYYNLMSRDSLPLYSAELEVAQIIIEPKVSKASKDAAKEKIQELRQRIIDGENFKTLALIYSDDKVSAKQGGELGYFSRGLMVPEFEAAAFKLMPDSISRVVETKYGYHIIQAINRKGDDMNARHILIMPKIYKNDVELAQHKADSILYLIKLDSISFENAAKKFSDDAPTKNNGGLITDANGGGTKIPVDELDKDVYLKVSTLKPGEYTDPELITINVPEPKKVWRILYLKSETHPHRCNPRDDYQKLQQMALVKKQNSTMQKWLDKNRNKFYVYVSDTFKDCDELKPWLKK
ncbi:MAG: peptidylprolyl isomerase [Bacteroidetes bacterium]|nr:peptidylprolyl isomerase [Bacteroidota bacterium]